METSEKKIVVIVDDPLSADSVKEILQESSLDDRVIVKEKRNFVLIDSYYTLTKTFAEEIKSWAVVEEKITYGPQRRGKKGKYKKW